MTSDRVSPWLTRGLYLFGCALLVTALIDLFTTVWPVRPSDIAWRYGFLGLGAGYVQTPTLGLVIVMGTATWTRDRGVLRAAGTIALVAALLILVAMGLFGLDFTQIATLREEEMRSAVLAGGVFQEVKYFIEFFVLAFLGQGALRTAKKMSSSGSKAEKRIVASAG